MWCNLSSFHHYRGVAKDVEPHYHATGDEIWVWGAGSADGIVDGQAVDLRRGVVVYTPVGCIHEYAMRTKHDNTGIQPRLRPGAGRNPHRRVGEHGPAPEPRMSAFWFLPEENTPQRPAVFPKGAFLRSAYRCEYNTGESVSRGRRDAWWALLVWEGCSAGDVDGRPVDLGRDDVLVVSAGSEATLTAAADAELVFAIGR